MSTPPWTTIIFTLEPGWRHLPEITGSEPNPEKPRSWDPEPGENQFFTTLTLNLEQGRRAYPELSGFRRSPERFIRTSPDPGVKLINSILNPTLERAQDTALVLVKKLRSVKPNPGVRLVPTTFACNPKPVLEIVLESVGSNPEKLRGLNPEPSTHIVNSCTGSPSNQWTIRPWGILCTNISVRLVKVMLPDICHTNLKPEIVFTKPNKTKHDIFKNNSTAPPKPFSARGRGTHNLTQTQTQIFGANDDVEYSFQIENLFRPILSSIELKLKLGSLMCLYSYYNIYLFSLVTDQELNAAIQTAKTLGRARSDEGHSRVLFPPQHENLWGEGRLFSKEAILQKACGYTLRMNMGRDAQSMQHFIQSMTASGFQDPGLAPRNVYLPAGAPLLDFLISDTNQPTGWKVPSIPVLQSYQAGRGLTMEILSHVEVKEITVGIS